MGDTKINTGTADEAKKALTEQLGTEESNIDDIDIISPESECFKLGDREYEIKPLPLGRIKLLVRLSKLQDKLNTEEGIDETIMIIGKVIGEKDVEFLGEHITVDEITDLFKIIEKVNYRGAPKKKVV